MNKKITKMKPKITKVLKENGVVRAGIFGSYASGEESKTSDIDILVEFKGRKSLLDLSRVELNLEKILKKRVDVITYNSIHPLLKDSILGHEVRIL